MSDTFGSPAGPATITRVGIVGTGRMGSAIGGRLLASGFPVSVHNRTRSHAGTLLDAGATWADTPAAVVEGSDVVLTVLFDDRAVLDVYERPDGLLSRRASDRIFVEMSTVRTATTLRIAQAAQTQGGGLVDAPVAGPPAAALAGQLLVLAGGSDDDLERVNPVLSAISRRIAHLGPTGSGTTMKLVLMTSMAVYFSGLAEALAMGTQLGLEIESMLGVILDSHGAPPVLHDRAGALLEETSGGRAAVGFPVSGVRKDLEAVLATAIDCGVPAASAATAFAAFTAATAAGYADRDLVSVVEHLGGAVRAAVPRPAITDAMWGRSAAPGVAESRVSNPQRS